MVASLLQVASLSGGRALVGGDHERRKVGLRGGNLHRALKESIGTGRADNRLVTNAIGCHGNDSPTIDGGKFHCGFVPKRGWVAEGWDT